MAEFSEFLAKELWNEITTNGLYAKSKTDFYDYVLYLLNKADKNHFFDTNDNAKNERLLKVNSTHIKAAKKNISVKFMNNDEYEAIFHNFIKSVADGSLSFFPDEGENYKIMIEDSVLRSVLEAKLKKSAKTTFDYHLNKEIVCVSHKDFVTMLIAETYGANTDEKEILKQITKELEHNHNKKEILESIQKVLESDSWVSFGKNALEVVASFVKSKLSNTL